MRIFYKAEFWILTFLIITGLFLVNIWGYNWDEMDQYFLGRHTFEYLRGERQIDQITNIRYGSAFELFAYCIQYLFAGDHSQFLAKHIILHLFFIIFLIVFFRFLNSFFENKLLAITGVLILVFSPRIYGDSFHNSKDIVFMICTFFTFISLYTFAKTPTNRNLFYHILVTVLLLDTRFAGIFMAFVTGFVFFVLSIQHRTYFRYIKLFTVFLLSSFTLLYIVWLYPRFLVQAEDFSRISELFHYDWGGNVLYFGKQIACSALPSDYFFVWLGISTPVLLLAIIVAAFLFTIYYLFYKRLKIFSTNKDLFLLVAFLIVVVMCLLAYCKKVIMYDAWRQMFFLYPFMVFLVIYFFHFIKEKSNYLYKAAMAVCFISFAETSIFYLTQFPFYNLYFNQLVSHKKNYLFDNFEIDYWGTSYKQALEYIDTHDTSSSINIYYENPPCEINLHAMRNRMKHKMHLTKDKLEAAYFVSNGRDTISEIRDTILWKPYKTFIIFNSPFMQIKKKK